MYRFSCFCRQNVAYTMYFLNQEPETPFLTHIKQVEARRAHRKSPASEILRTFPDRVGD